MKKLVILSVVACLLAPAAAEVRAWELELEGEAIWRHRYVTRTGGNDIFGYMNGDTGVNLGINHLRDYPTPETNNAFQGGPPITATSRGVIAGEHNFGPDMGLTDCRVTFYPTVKVNKAVKLRASINLTSLGIHSNGRPYYNMEMDDLGSVDTTGGGYANSLWVPISDRPAGSNVPNTFVTVQWAEIKIETPMLNFSLGYKTSAWGIGLWKNREDRASASFSMSSHYGPFKFGISPYFGRAQSSWNTWPRNDRNDHAPWRREGDRNYFGGLTLGFAYASGPLTITFDQNGWHTPNWPNASYEQRQGTGLPDTSISLGRPGEDTWVYDTSIGLKYFNGRGFLYAEVCHFWEYNSGRGTVERASGAYFTRAGRNQDAWIYGGEGGLVLGPSKLTFSYVRATGDDPSTRITNEDALNGNAGVSPYALVHWGYLMYYLYGTGTGWNAAGEGQCSNLHHLGAKLDYAAAANLNAFAVLSYAWRDQVNAYMLAGNGLHTAEAVDNDTVRFAKGLPVNHTPQFIAVPALVRVVPEYADDIGYEVDWGFDWKLLENLDWNLTCALWFPGSFWGHAYPNTGAMYNDPAVNAFLRLNVPPAAADIAVARSNPARPIDAVFAMQTALRVSF